MMRMPRHWIAIAMVLVTPGLLWSTETSPEQRRGERAELDKRQMESRSARVQAARRAKAPESVRNTRIFTLRHQDADGLAKIITALVPSHEATVAVDGLSQSLIVAASPDRLQQIERVIHELDVAPIENSDVPQMLYRIYMLELPLEHENLKPFSMVLKRSLPLPAREVLEAVTSADVQLDTFIQDSNDIPNETYELIIEGRAASNDVINRMLEKIPDAYMNELRWKDEISTPPPAQVAQLPGGLKKHVEQLLGGSARTVGYWFGNLSVPGTVRAPIGPWLFDMEVSRSAGEGQVELEISVESHWQPGQGAWKILGNSLRSHIMKPVIIGYNRESYGTRVMGAMVIVPEESPVP